MGIALVCTVRNERASIDVLLDSLATQTRRPDEVVFLDGGSSDGTAERIAARAGALGIRLLRAPDANIARGRNLAIAATTQEIIAVTDAGVRLAPDWLERITAPFATAAPPDVVAGFFVPEADTPFERAMAATVLPALADVRPTTFLPSSRSVAFRRVWWERVGGYPEWLDYCEDLVFDLALRAAGARFAFAPEAIVFYRPRRTLSAFFQQYFRYARGDGKADLWRHRHAVRYGAYATGLVLLGLSRRRPALLGLLAALGALYVRRPYERLMPSLRGLTASERAVGLALIPLIRLTGDVAKMLGYPAGVWWRWRSGARCAADGRPQAPPHATHHRVAGMQDSTWRAKVPHANGAPRSSLGPATPWTEWRPEADVGSPTSGPASEERR